ncbi:hypothetical protein P3S67_028830 [Capsicum chacoense]
MKNSINVAAFVFAHFIVFVITTTSGDRVCLLPFDVPQPCDSNYCNALCNKQYGEKPPGAIKGPLRGGNCIGQTCFCIFCCFEKCTDFR